MFSANSKVFNFQSCLPINHVNQVPKKINWFRLWGFICSASFSWLQYCTLIIFFSASLLWLPCLTARWEFTSPQYLHLRIFSWEKDRTISSPSSFWSRGKPGCDTVTGLVSELAGLFCCSWEKWVILMLAYSLPRKTGTFFLPAFSARPLLRLMTRWCSYISEGQTSSSWASWVQTVSFLLFRFWLLVQWKSTSLAVISVQGISYVR